MKIPLKLPAEIKAFMDTFRAHKFQIFVVGGAVRNLILNKTITNWDFATNARPEMIQELFKESKYNNDYGTVLIPFDINNEKNIAEVTPFRKESAYEDSRHPSKIEWANSIEEDVKRRDFTINALAFDGSNIIDLVGGQKDMDEKVICSVGDPDKRFNEDALRLLRAVRFATQLEYLIEDHTKESIKKNAQLITKISWERIKDEFFKILESDHPADGVLFLKQVGLLHYILPEIEECFSVQQKSPERHHIYDVGTHLIEALKNCPSKDAVTRFSVLIHDVGKARTYAKDEKSGLITFYNHEIVGAQMAEEIANRFRLSKKEKSQFVTLVRHHMFSVNEKQTDKALRRFIRTVGKENLQHMLDLRTADRVGSRARTTSWRTELFKKRLIEVQKKPFTVTDLKITGHDIMEILYIKPGPKIGEILKKIFDDVVEEKVKNEKKALVELIKLYSK